MPTLRFTPVLSIAFLCLAGAEARVHAAIEIASNGVTRQFSFSGVATNGTGSGTLTIKGTYDSVSNTTTFFSTIDNTSPYTLNSPQVGTNSPAITSWGFDTNSPTSSLLSWQITGKNSSGGTIILGQKGASGNLWAIDQGEKVGGFKVDLLADNDGAPSDQSIHYGLYRPGALSPGPNPYYTQATLTVTLAGDVNMLFNPVQSDPSPFIRLQRVGTDGSLKLYGGTPQIISNAQGDVPEPATLAIWGLGVGIAGLVKLSRRKK
jgi:hypothetical protein